ncbi:hypothetical protein [Celeribacter sp.]|uniref:hypothetical protein n=1 Tax=Celeribacter sp. TaxID=1890673 RepID=UPI003A8D5DC5
MTKWSNEAQGIVVTALLAAMPALGGRHCPRGCAQQEHEEQQVRDGYGWGYTPERFVGVLDAVHGKPSI